MLQRLSLANHLRYVAVLVGVKPGPFAETLDSAQPLPRTPSSVAAVHQSAPTSFAAFVAQRLHSAQYTALSMKIIALPQC